MMIMEVRVVIWSGIPYDPRAEELADPVTHPERETDVRKKGDE